MCREMYLFYAGPTNLGNYEHLRIDLLGYFGKFRTKNVFKCAKSY